MLILLVMTRLYSETTTVFKDCGIKLTNKACDGKNLSVSPNKVVSVCVLVIQSGLIIWDPRDQTRSSALLPLHWESQWRGWNKRRNRRSHGSFSSHTDRYGWKGEGTQHVITEKTENCSEVVVTNGILQPGHVLYQENVVIMFLITLFHRTAKL